MLAGLSQGYLYLSEHWLSKTQASTIDAVNAVFTALFMAYSLVVIGEDTLKVGVSVFIVGKAVVAVGMGAPVVVPMGRTSVTRAFIVGAVVVRVVGGCVNVVVAAHFTFSCRVTSLTRKSDWPVRLLLHDPVGLIASSIAGLFVPVLLRCS